MVLKSSKKKVVKGLRLAGAALLALGMFAGQALAEDAPAVVAPAPVMEAGSSANGAKLFTGEVSFKNGGPPCISCHSASYGALDGGTLGPNLTKVYADETKNGLVSVAWINAPSIPTMGQVFGEKHSITEAEIGDLRAFLQQQSMANSAAIVTNEKGATVTIVGILGFIGILIIFTIIWSGRYANRAKNTAHDALWRNYGGKGGR